MTPGIRPLVAGNWKMNGTAESLPQLAAIGKGFMSGLDAETEALICVPATLLSRASDVLRATPVRLGGQDCHAQDFGAHTGDISAGMLKDAGAAFVLAGHSERRNDHGESDEAVRAKVEAAWRAGLCVIICIGETLAQREARETLAVLSRQIAGSLPAQALSTNTIIAYEPMWAIGSGLTPSAKDITTAHAHIRSELVRHIGEDAGRMRILYGGSVKPDNATELLALANVDGALVGGASLKASDFLGIAEAYRSF